MNFLAHALLAGPDDDYRLGGLLGDFVKGPLVSPPTGCNETVLSGIRLHRRIDSFADTHPAFLRSRRRVSVERRRYSGIMIDMFYDHFLAKHWHRYSPTPLEVFSADVYALLARHCLPERLAAILPAMRRENWLTAYRDPLAVVRALDQMARFRLRGEDGLTGAGGELLANAPAFEQDFLAFFPEAVVFAECFRSRQGAGARQGSCRLSHAASG
ncbi:MAG TPA: acyl carrier protein phosphodiesterase [Accumulibacter sp.]|nr:acyl carrier protein phosphodiesterase [Accumulibacter sp.]